MERMVPYMEPLSVKIGFLQFPPSNTCDGGDLSPEIRLAGLNATSVALMAVNPFQPSCCTFSPWIIWNIDPSPVIPAGIPKEEVVTTPLRAVQGRNDFGKIGYTGPCPPTGATHRYTFKVWGLDTYLDIPPGSLKGDLIKAMQGHVIQYGETVAMYSR
jgi:Raf kinase inhibitor-like YbhB/YbcL family protein